MIVKQTDDTNVCLMGHVHVASSSTGLLQLDYHVWMYQLQVHTPSNWESLQNVLQKVLNTMFLKISFFKVYDSLIHSYTIWAIPNIWCTKIPFLYLHMYFWHGNYYNTGLVFILSPPPFIHHLHYTSTEVWGRVPGISAMPQLQCFKGPLECL